MRKPLLITGVLLCLSQIRTEAQINLNWATSFSPSWSNGALSRTASNIGGNTINCTATVSITGPGSFSQAMGSSGSQTPTVSGAVFTVPGSVGRLQLTPNFNQKSSYATVTLSFNAMTTNVSFRIVDIDKSDATSTTYLDRVTITGSNGVSSFQPTITKYDAVTDPGFLVISGNSAWVNPVSGMAGNSNSDLTDQRGTINVNFGSAVINTVTIIYDNHPSSNNNPANQSIAIGELSFSQSTLPVTLTDFSGYRKNRDIWLHWTTGQEINAASFEIERSTGASWEKIGMVAAAGNSDQPIQYQFRDLSPQGDLLLYRLKQVDLNNQFKYSSVVRISAAATIDELKTYPNPVHDQLSVGIYSPVQQNVRIEIADAGGRVLRQNSRQLVAGENNIMLTGFAGLPKGLYIIMVRDAGGRLTGSRKITKE